MPPEDASVRNNLGNTYCDQGDYTSAIKEFHDLYRLEPDWEGGHSCLARAFMAQKKYPAAVEELRTAVRLNPQGAPERRVLGQALLLSGKPPGSGSRTSRGGSPKSFVSFNPS